jgi:hypothetical protein
VIFGACCFRGVVFPLWVEVRKVRVVAGLWSPGNGVSGADGVGGLPPAIVLVRVRYPGIYPGSQGGEGSPWHSLAHCALAKVSGILVLI